MNSEAMYLERIRDVFQDLFGIARRDVTAETSPRTLSSWDSLQHLNVAMAIEEAFTVELAPEEIEQIDSVGAILEMLERKGAGAR